MQTSEAAVTAAKIRLREATTASAAARNSMDEAQVRAAADIASAELARAEVGTLERRRAAGVQAARPGAVVAAESALLAARVRDEIEMARSVRSTSKLATETEKLRQAEAEVKRCEKAVEEAARVELAGRVLAAWDVFLALGTELAARVADNPYDRPINVPPAVLPAAVTAALSKLPQVHPLDQPITRLRSSNGGAVGAGAR